MHSQEKNYTYLGSQDNFLLINIIWMQDDSNLTWSPNKIHMPRENDLSKLKTTPLIKIFTNKTHFTINFVQLIYKTCEILSAFTNQCHLLHIQCVVVSTFTVGAFTFSLLSLHNAWSLVPSSALKIQYFSKSFTITLVRCAAMPWSTDKHESHWTSSFFQTGSKDQEPLSIQLL